MFESGGTSGSNVLLGRRVHRFRCEVEPSRLDEAPTLALRYDGLGNGWPVAHLFGELRQVQDNFALGAAFWRDSRKPMLWFGLKL
jgi:hypothetical protein